MTNKNYYSLIEQNQSKFETYYSELISYNMKVNLTAITDKQEVFTKHFLDSILAIDHIPNGAKLIDIGAGAGFPSLPLKIVRPDIDLTMLDSLNKRITFLDMLTTKLNIRTTNIHARAEEYCMKHREEYDVAVARAVASLDTLAEYLLPFVKVGGTVLAYKGSNIDNEVLSAQKAITTLGGEISDIVHFDLPNQMGERNIVVIKKVKPTPTKYPRQQNKPKTNPIK